MNAIKNLLVASAVVGIMGSAAMTSGVYAQSAPPQPAADAPAKPGGGPRAGMGHMACDPNGATQLQTRLDTVATKLALTAAQTPLFDAYKTAALSAQTTFADACSKVAPATDGTAPDMLTRMKDRQVIATAEVAALNATLPSFEAFFTSLTDAQKAQMAPKDHGPRDGGEHGRKGHEGRDGGHGDNRGGRHNGPRDNSQYQGTSLETTAPADANIPAVQG